MNFKYTSKRLVTCTTITTLAFSLGTWSIYCSITPTLSIDTNTIHGSIDLETGYNGVFICFAR